MNDATFWAVWILWTLAVGWEFWRLGRRWGAARERLKAIRDEQSRIRLRAEDWIDPT